MHIKQEISLNLVDCIAVSFLVVTLYYSYVRFTIGGNSAKRIQDLSVISQKLKKKKMNKAGLPWNFWFSVFSLYLDVSSVICTEMTCFD